MTRAPQLRTLEDYEEMNQDNYRRMSAEVIQRHEHNDTLPESKAAFHQIFDSSSVGMAQADCHGRFKRVNRALCRLTGYHESELLTRSLEELVHPDERVACAAAFAELLRGSKQAFQAEDRILRKNGNTLWVNVTIDVVRNLAGEPLYAVAVIQDITTRKHEVAALREVAQRHEQQVRLFDAIASSTPDFVYLFDLQGRFLYANRHLLDVWGMKLDDVIGKTCRELGYEQWHHDMHMREIAQVIKTKGPIKGEVPFKAPLTGVFGVYEYIFTPVIGSDGKLELIAGTTRDVTDRKRAEEELRNRGEQFQTLLNRAPIGAYLIDADFRIAQVNPVAAPVFGDIPDLIGRNFDDVLHILWEKQYADEVVRLFRHTLETGEPFHMPERAQLRADRGVIEYYEWRIDRITLPDGGFGVVCYFSDISGQVRARQVIAESEERHRTLFESIDEGFCILQLIFDEKQRPIDYRFIEINPAFEKQTGMKNALGRTIRELVPNLEESWFRIYGNVALTGEPTRFVDHAQSMGRWFDVYAFRVGKPHDRRVAVLFNDITERKNAEAALAKSQEELKQHAATLEATVAERTARLRETVQQLETFSYSIVHDMRAPLRSMRSFAGLLQDDYQDKLDEPGRKYIQRIMNAAGRLDALITDVLSYSRITMNEAALQRVDMDRLVTDILGAYPQFEEIAPLVHVQRPLPALLGNTALLTQVFSNLLGNAFKFVAPGREPRVDIRSEKLGNVVRLWVEDNGIGIAAEHRDQIFELFKRLHGSDQYPGTGVGLAIVKAAVERMGGRIGVESEPGTGSRFWFELPPSPPEPYPRGAA